MCWGLWGLCGYAEFISMRGTVPAAGYLFFARPKKRYEKKGRPTAAPSYGWFPALLAWLGACQTGHPWPDWQGVHPCTPPSGLIQAKLRYSALADGRGTSKSDSCIEGPRFAHPCVNSMSARILISSQICALMVSTPRRVQFCHCIIRKLCKRQIKPIANRRTSSGFSRKTGRYRLGSSFRSFERSECWCISAAKDSWGHIRW